ncbi:hypothetical protein [Azospirillum soli]|uniref:hypothetical protein n=1 Tax=Azospirillum soli TaxID=1304799 RepID=UPI001AE0FE76|nr:hypothetical protein [Azospirillum soli]MBP2313292.1 hypothetical protein [Azospirillum soli]
MTAAIVTAQELPPTAQEECICINQSAPSGGAEPSSSSNISQDAAKKLEAIRSAIATKPDDIFGLPEQDWLEKIVSIFFHWQLLPLFIGAITFYILIMQTRSSSRQFNHLLEIERKAYLSSLLHHSEIYRLQISSSLHKLEQAVARAEKLRRQLSAIPEEKATPGGRHPTTVEEWVETRNRDELRQKVSLEFSGAFQNVIECARQEIALPKPLNDDWRGLSLAGEEFFLRAREISFSQRDLSYSRERFLEQINTDKTDLFEASKDLVQTLARIREEAHDIYHASSVALRFRGAKKPSRMPRSLPDGLPF